MRFRKLLDETLHGRCNNDMVLCTCWHEHSEVGANDPSAGHFKHRRAVLHCRDLGVARALWFCIYLLTDNATQGKFLPAFCDVYEPMGKRHEPLGEVFAETIIKPFSSDYLDTVAAHGRSVAMHQRQSCTYPLNQEHLSPRLTVETSITLVDYASFRMQKYVARPCHSLPRYVGGFAYL